MILGKYKKNKAHVIMVKSLTKMPSEIFSP